MFIRTSQRPDSTIDLPIIGLMVVAAAMLSRIPVAVFGAPGMTNFVHFGFVCLLLIAALLRPRPLLYSTMFGGLLGFAVVIIASGLVNGAGAINVLLEFLLLGEPFLLIIGLTCALWPAPWIPRVRQAVLLMVCVHFALAYYQGVVEGHHGDSVRGAFLEQGAGAHVAGAVALTAGYFFALTSPGWPTWWRATFMLISLGVVVMADAKQVLVVMLASLIGMGVLKLRRGVSRTIKYLVFAGGMVALVMILAATILPAMEIWRKDIDIEGGIRQKFSVFEVMGEYFDSPINWFVGLGPGHTITRLGLLLPKYIDILEPLGATTSVVTDAVLEANESSLMSSTRGGSSMWSLTFSWAGVWGDLGIVGLAAYLALGVLVWVRYCRDDITRFMVINVAIFGAIFNWIEEPGYILFAAVLICLRWQQLQRDPAAAAVLSELKASAARSAAASAARASARRVGGGRGGRLGGVVGRAPRPVAPSGPVVRRERGGATGRRRARADGAGEQT